MSNIMEKRLMSLYKETIEDGNWYNGSLEDINYYNLIFKAGTDNNLKTWGDYNACAYKYIFNDKESILIIICLPINSAKESSTSKNVAERIMEIIKNSENCFTTLDYNTSVEVKKDKFIYITLIKEIKQ